MSPPEDLWLHFVASVFGKTSPGKIGVAVSGGGDSVALLHLLHQWAADEGVALYAVTVDHGLRDASAGEAAGVATFCDGLNIPHDTLKWTGWNGKGNLQDQARRARYGLMADWARARGINTVALGHTADDQAETFLLRLARGSGVDGLSGMRARRDSGGITWVRPALLLYREGLRDYLRERGISWVDDPTNEDEVYERVKVRNALKVLSNLGITPEKLVQTSEDLAGARHALEVQTLGAAQAIAQVQAGDVVLQRAGFNNVPFEISRRLLVHALSWVSGADYSPRRDALMEVIIAIHGDTNATLHGCRILVSKTEIRITRELQAVKDMRCASDKIWDGRWQLSGPHAANLEVRALGEVGIKLCPDWREQNLPRASVLASPAVWQKDKLISAPSAGFPNGWQAKLRFGPEHFTATILSH